MPAIIKNFHRPKRDYSLLLVIIGFLCVMINHSCNKPSPIDKGYTLGFFNFKT
jgi:hypothetical protein